MLTTFLSRSDVSRNLNALHLLKELRAASADKRNNVEAFFHLAVEMAALIFSQEEADLLRRRGRAAMPAAA